ncbi:mechanosensitive ion channel family protein [Candidatus Woesearchaeota archaeon]|nr:mechanosensitive ion channel family protein [Candidatus Woesearchaeota archaeon]
MLDLINFTEIKIILANSLNRILLVAVILFITIVFARIIKKLLTRSFERSSKYIKADPTKFTVFKHIISALIYIIGIGIAIYLIPTLRGLSISLFAGAGVLAIVIGFASQKAVSNIISGIFIALFQPFRVGDIIKFSDNVGYVEDITLRHTVLRNFENKRIIVPNSTISDATIENYNIKDEKVCRFVDFGISYDSDIDKAMRIIQKEAEKHPEFLDTRTEAEKKERKPAVTVRVIGFGDSSVNLRAWVWAKDPLAAFRLGTDLNKSIKERFDKSGIEIPFPYRTVVFKDKKRKRKR